MEKSTNVVTQGKATGHSDSKGKFQRFIPPCYFCGVRGHIRTRYFTMMNFIKNHYMVPFERKTPRSKVDLNVKPNKIWVRKSNFNCFALFTCLRIFATNSCHFDSGCSRL